jgi:hypothetical protein
MYDYNPAQLMLGFLLGVFASSLYRDLTGRLQHLEQARFKDMFPQPAEPPPAD